MASSDDQMQQALMLLQKNLNAAVKNIASMVGSSGSSGGSSASDKKLRNSQNGYIDAMDDAATGLNGQARVQKALIALTKRLTDVGLDSVKYTEDANGNKKREADISDRNQKALETYNKLLRESSSYLKDQQKKAYELSYKSLPEQMEAMQALTSNASKFTKTLAQSQRNASLFSAALIQQHGELKEGTGAYKNYIDGLGKAALNFDKSFLETAGLWDKRTKELKENLTPEDFAKFRLAMGQAEGIITDNFSSLGKLGFKSPRDIQSMEGGVEGADKKAFAAGGGQFDATNAIRGTVMELTRAGHRLELGFDLVDEKGQITAEGLTKLNEASGDKLLKSIIKFDDSVKKTNTSLTDMSLLANTTIGRLRLTLGNFVNDVEKHGIVLTAATAIAKSAIAAKGMDMAKEGMKQGYGELVDFNVAGVSASFAEVQEMSVKLGMSFKDTVEMLQHNKRILGLYGDAGFEKLNGQLGSTFRQFGYNMQQSAAIVGPAIASAVAVGVDVRNGDVNGFVKKTMDSFGKIRGIVDITAQKYFELNAELAQTSEINHNMLGMSREQAGLYFDGLESQRNMLVARGLELQQAQEIVKAQEKAKHETVNSRIENAGKVTVAMGNQGYSNEEIMRARNVMMQGRLASKEDSAWLTETLGKVGTEADRKAQQSGNMQGLITQEVLNEATHLTGAYGALEEAGFQTKTVDRANLGATGADQKRIDDAAKGSQAVAAIGDKINQATSFINNSFTKSLVGASLAALGLSANFLLLSKVSGGKGGLGGMLEALIGGKGGGGGFFSRFGGKGAVNAAEGLAETAAGATAEVAGSVATKSVEKTVEKTVAEKGGEAVIKATGKAVGKEGAEIGAKGLGKSLMKKIPGLGVLAALGFGAQRAFAGDWTGAGMEVASGAASIVPGVGTAASIGIDAALAGRDIYKATNEAAPAADVNATVTPADETTPSVTGAQQSGTSKAVNTTESGNKKTNASAESKTVSGIMAVQDDASQAQLAIIADNMVQAVVLLQKMLDVGASSQASGNSGSFSGGQYPVANAFSTLTGRVSA